MDFGDRVAAVGALAERVRRDLYRYVVDQGHPVSRDQASEGLGLPRHTAKFHLDKLVEDGLLVTEFQRLTGRRGPGAGRPAKLYRRSDRELSVSLPERHYDLAGTLMARAIEESLRGSVPVDTALRSEAATFGRRLGEEVEASVPPRSAWPRVLDGVRQALADHGYEPRQRGRSLELGNCPFHRLAQEHTELVCGMNLALLGAAAEQVADGRLVARLEPAPGRCCVVLAAAEEEPGSTGGGT